MKVVRFSDWEKIEKVEHGCAKEGAPRVKVTEWRAARPRASRE
ncbi:hypothetical protein [Sandaracinus amylolyticus]|nr:hypothetical protein [Sandaracinus amylolyticus]UJR87283.1 Hypothetical protein I5071_750 [Sandaracinus amylolyticus]